VLFSLGNGLNALNCADMMKTGIGNNKMRQTGRLALFFLLLFVLATFATAFHHHADGSEHHDCPLCVAGHHHSSARVAVFSITNQQPVTSNEVLNVSLLYNFVRVSLLPCRAPPA
jgi:hypothetical protein